MGPAHDGSPGVLDRRSTVARVAVLAGVWSLPAIVLLLLTYGVGPAYGFDPPHTLVRELLFVQIPLWGGWAVATPVIFRLSARHHPSQGKVARPLLVHLGAATVMWLTHTLVLAAVQWPAGLFEASGLAQAFVRLVPQYAVLEYIVYAVVAASGFALHMMRESRRSELRAARLENRLSEARLESLRMQLHPHFLFNALNTVVMQMRREAHERALDLLLRFSELLREILEMRRSMIPLHEEIELARRYLSIESARFGDRLGVMIDEDPAAADALVPTLLLQPLVENAFRHGVDRREDDVTVRLSTTREGNSVTIQIRNDGPRLSEGWSGEKDEGMGLTLTRKRVEEAFGDEATVVIRNEDRGVLVGLSLPYLPAREPFAAGMA